jgi:hypothetical protein
MHMEFTTEYSNLTSRQFAEQIMESIQQQHGVDLRKIFENDAMSVREKARIARVRLTEALLADLEHSGTLDAAADADFDEEQALNQLLDTEVDIEPNISLLTKDAAVVMEYRGDDVRQYMYTLTKRMENAGKAKTPGQLAIELVAGGVISVGVPMAVGTIKALRAGQAVLAAVRSGVTSIGLKTAIGAIVVVLVGFLLYLFLENPKKVLGMVINGTDKNLIVKDWQKGLDGQTGSDLFMAFGHMASYMKDNEEGLASPEVQVRARVDFGPNDPDNVVFGGIYFADRNFGLRGAEGAMLFTSRDSDIRIGHLFACPYFEDNGAYVAMAQPGQTAQQFYNDYYGKRQVSLDHSEGGYRLRSNVNDARGGVLACIASITN